MPTSVENCSSVRTNSNSCRNCQFVECFFTDEAQTSNIRRLSSVGIDQQVLREILLLWYTSGLDFGTCFSITCQYLQPQSISKAPVQVVEPVAQQMARPSRTPSEGSRYEINSTPDSSLNVANADNQSLYGSNSGIKVISVSLYTFCVFNVSCVCRLDLAFVPTKILLNVQGRI